MRTQYTHHTYARRRQPKKSRRRLLFAAIFGVGLFVFCSYIFGTFNKNSVSPPIETISSKPVLSKDIRLTWPATGQAAIGSMEDGVLARSSDNEVLRPTASMAKVITALAIMEKQPLKPGQAGPLYTINANDVANYRAQVAKNGSVLPVYEGMVLTQHEALQAMLIASANNIAEMLVQRTFGSEEAYISYAQAMLKRMGLDQTVVADASGYSPDTASTPSELIAIGIAALKNPVIAEIVVKPQAQIPGVGTVKNTNELLGTSGVVGIKTGTTGEAGSCLLFAAQYTRENDRKVTVVGVIMDDSDATTLFNDSRNLLASAKQGWGLADVQSTSTSAPTQRIKH